VSKVVLHGLQIFKKYLSGGWGQLVFRFILGLGVCAFPHVLGMEESKQNCRLPLRIISETALNGVPEFRKTRSTVYNSKIILQGHFTVVLVSVSS